MAFPLVKLLLKEYKLSASSLRSSASTGVCHQAHHCHKAEMLPDAAEHIAHQGSIRNVHASSPTKFSRTIEMKKVPSNSIIHMFKGQDTLDQSIPKA